MKPSRIALCIIFFTSFAACAQELFPIAEPASTVPKGVLGVKIISQFYKEVRTTRSMFAGRFMYGLTPKWTVWVQPSISNHHGAKLPNNFLNHRHVGSATVAYASTKRYGNHYPFAFGGFHFYSKYRFFSADGEKKHLRMAAYGEYSTVKTAHDEAEPDIQENNGGYGGGLIITKLNNRFAASLTTGFIVPNNYKERKEQNVFGDILSIDVEMLYGRAVTYNLSLGYLLYPKHYENYNQANYNIYIELMGKSYGAATVLINGEKIESKTEALKAGHYMEMHIGVQKIINSNLRINFSLGFNLINRSYTRFYPIDMISAQRYFYFN